MVTAALTRLRIAMLTTVSIIAVGISVTLVTTGRSAEQSGPSSERSADDLTRHAIERRAVEAVIWGMPAVNYHLMYQEMVRKTKGDFNQVLYWSRLLDWKNQTLTPNPDVIYLMPFFNTKHVGPVVLEIPPADDGLFNGSVMNYWQAAIEDVGPGGVDKGEGGKYLILPPGYDKSSVPPGYIAMPSDTYRGYALLRSVLKSGSEADIVNAVAYAKRIKVYPLSQAASPPPTVFVDAADVVFDSLIPYDLRFFEALNQIVQAEPWLERDRAMIDPLKTIGIERGKPFDPDAKTQQILNDAIHEAKAWLDARYDKLPPYYEGGRWFFPITEEMHQNVMSDWQTPDSYPVDARGTVYTLAFFSAKHLGQAQYYLLTASDKDGKPLNGSASYRVKVPANAPIAQYWSMTVYDRETHAFIRNARRVGRSSQAPGLQSNADGSVDIFFGATAPLGQESNWIPTDANGRFEVLARFYGPQKPLFDKTWRLPDIEKIAVNELALKAGYPTPELTQRVRDDQDYQRAVHAYRFFYPTVSMEGTLHGQRDAGAEDNKSALILAGGPRHVLFTGNSDTPYMSAALNLKTSGPMVIEMPAGSYLGVINDHHFRWVHDLGIPGEDAGRGGKHLVLPPSYEGKVPAGYYVARSNTNLVVLAARAIPIGGDMKGALEAQRKIKVYPLAQSAQPPPFAFLDLSNQSIDVTLLRWEDNLQYWEQLHKIIQEEPVLEEFRPMYGMLAALGLEQGKPFTPDARMKAILERAAKAGRDEMLVAGFGSSRPDRIVWPDRRWEWAALRYENGDFELPTGIDLEARDRWFSQAVGASPKMFLRTPGAGSLYWLGLRDKEGAYLDGGKTYKLSVPQPVPQKLFWSVTVYDSQTRSQIQTDQDKAALRSLVELNDAAKTGATDLYFGPTPPGQEGRWIKTNPGRGWFAYLRLYGPEGPAFDGTWKPGDFEQIAPSSAIGRALQ